MQLTKHMTKGGPRWALDGELLPQTMKLETFLGLPKAMALEMLETTPTEGPIKNDGTAPVGSRHEIWACGVTYLRSREAREAESKSRDVYDRVYSATRPELFFKSIGWRAVGHKAGIRIRSDSEWNVPEPEMVLVINRYQEIVGFTAGNDISSRDIEGENPLYLPQAKIYEGACAVGPAVRVAESVNVEDLSIALEVWRRDAVVFNGSTSTAQMRRPVDSLVEYLFRELRFPFGVLLMTGTGIVPPDDFTLQPGDRVVTDVGSLRLENVVTRRHT